MLLTYTLDFEKQAVFHSQFFQRFITEYENMEKIKITLLYTLCHDINYITVLF